MKSTESLRILALISCVFFLVTCKKEILTPESSSPGNLPELSISEAKKFFETEIIPQESNRKQTKTSNLKIDEWAKISNWEKAYQKDISIGKVIIVPLQYSTETFLKIDSEKEDVISLDKLSYLMIYRATAGQLIAEWGNSYSR